MPICTGVMAPENRDRNIKKGNTLDNVLPFLFYTIYIVSVSKSLTLNLKKIKVYINSYKNLKHRKWRKNSRTNKGRTGTGKTSRIYMNKNIIEALKAYKICAQIKGKLSEEAYLFAGPHGTPISRVQAWRIISRAADACELPGVISPHSLRKTFGYQAWHKGIQPLMLMEIYNHSSFAITKRYLGIQQDDRDEVFKNICI